MKAKSRQTRRGSGRSAGSGDTTIAFWLVAFLDMLGYRATLAKFDVYPLPTEPDEQAAFRKRFVHAVHLRRRLLGAIREFQDSTRRQMPLPADLPTEVRGIADRWRKAKLLRMPGPDHVVLATSLTGEVDHFPLRGVYDTVATACAAMLIQLALGADDHEQSLPLRGGVDIAPGAVLHPEDFLYSPALTRAYDLESKTAVYPRTLAGDRFLGYLRAHSEDRGSDPTTRYNAALADRVLSMFFRDADGKTALDFLGASFRENLTDELACTLATKAWKFAHLAQGAAKSGGDQRIIAKYDWLVSYLEPRIELWGVPR